jgi:hypothetical protein
LITWAWVISVKKIPKTEKNKDKKDGINYNIISFAFLRAGRRGGHILVADDGPCSSIKLGLAALTTQH